MVEMCGTTLLRAGQVNKMYKFVTFALDSVKLSTLHRKFVKGKERRLKRRHQGTWDPRIPPSTYAKMGRQCNYVEIVLVNGSMVNVLWGRSTEEELAKFKKNLHSWWKRKNTSPISKIDDFVKHVFREHNQEAVHWADVGSEGQKNVIDTRDNSESWKAVKGFLGWQFRRQW